MLIPVQWLAVAAVIFFLSCKNDHDYTYAIKDFRISLQPHLVKIVSEGIVMYSDSALKGMATDYELIQLSRSEHPALRASAVREILDRKSFNHFDFLMNHLDDTATVLIDEGEFGIARRTVSDDILLEALWANQEEKNKTIEKVLTKHNYLSAAYHILFTIDPQEKYYPFIKDMATRSKNLDFEGYELAFDEIEYALYGLAKFKKMEDVPIIKQQFTKNVWRLSYISFQLMKEYPDTAYLDIFETYHRRQFYRFSGNRRGGFTGTVPDAAEPEDFIRALCVQQNDRSARLLDTILTRLALLPCLPDKETIESEVILEIWKHPCKAYTGLRNKIKLKAEKMLNGRVIDLVDRHPEPTGVTNKPVRWWDY